MIKIIHDLRIKHIIQHGCPEDSIFWQDKYGISRNNCKIFYFHVFAETEDIIGQIKR